MKKLLLVSFLFLAGAMITLSAAPLADSDPGCNEEVTIEMAILDLDLDFLTTTGNNPWRGFPPYANSNPNDLDRATISFVLSEASAKLGLSASDMQTVYREGNCMIEVIGAGKYRLTTSGFDLVEIVDSAF